MYSFFFACDLHTLKKIITYQVIFGSSFTFDITITTDRVYWEVVWQLTVWNHQADLGKEREISLK